MSTILLVDDDPHLRELSRIFLQQEGFDIAEASDGVEALLAFERGKVDLV
ncbi:response regulator, partial [Klebsiella pneumoniae]